MTSSRTKRVLIGLLVVVLASAVGVEVGARLLDRARGKPWSAEGSRVAIEEVCRMLARRSYGAPRDGPGAATEGEGEPAILQPYTGWEHPSTQRRMAEAAAWYRKPKAKEVYDVCILGGSVAQLFVEYGHKRFLEVIQRDPRIQARGVRLHNLACAGYKQPQQSLLFAYVLALGHEPDIVIELDGFNEAALAWNNARSGTHPLYPHVPHWASSTTPLRSDWEMVERLHAVRTAQDRARAYGEWLLRSGLWRSCFLEHALSLQLERLRRRHARAYQDLMGYLQERPKDSEIRGPDFASDDESLAKTIVTCWVEGSLNLQAMCAERGIAYLHVLQPTLHDEGSKPLTQKEIDGGSSDPTWTEGVRKIYPLLREAAPELEERGIAFLDASGVFRDHPEDIYYDLCHFREHGNEILADAIGEAVLRLDPR